jgi:hypothetical protein
MTWGIRAKIRLASGTTYDLGEVKLGGEPFGYPDRETCQKAITILENGDLMALRGALEPFETGREIKFADRARVKPA